MTEHEKLKEIIDFIGYILSNLYRYKDGYFMEINCIPRDLYIEKTISVREIIFSPEFRDKFIEYGLESSLYDGYEAYRDIWKYLEDPVDYLYDLLEIGTNTQTKKY